MYILARFESVSHPLGPDQSTRTLTPAYLKRSKRSPLKPQMSPPPSIQNNRASTSIRQGFRLPTFSKSLRSRKLWSDSSQPLLTHLLFVRSIDLQSPFHSFPPLQTVTAYRFLTMDLFGDNLQLIKDVPMAKRPIKATSAHNGNRLRRPLVPIYLYSKVMNVSNNSVPTPPLPLHPRTAFASSMSLSTTPDVQENPCTSRAAAAHCRTPLRLATGAVSLFQPSRTRPTAAPAPQT